MIKISLEDERNLSMLVDFYEFTMANGYFKNNLKDKIVYFDMFFRKNPDNAGFAIVAGLEQVIEYIKGLNFTKNDIEYLRERSYLVKSFWSIY